MLRIAAVAGRSLGSHPDVFGYRALDFFGGALRPWTVPLLYAVVPTDGGRMVAQLLVSIVAWSALALVAAALCSTTGGKAIAFGGVLLIGSAPQVARWDLLLMSESVAVSLTVALIASWLAFVRWPSARTAVITGITSTLWLFTRPVHLAPFAAMTLGLGISLYWSRGRALRTWLLVAFVPVLAWGAFTVSREEGVQSYNLYLMAQVRVFTSVDRATWFVDRGMPVSNELLASVSVVPQRAVPDRLVDYAGIPDHFMVPTDVVVGGRPFVKWIRANGQTAYLSYLVAHPRYAFLDPLDRMSDFVAPTLESLTPDIDARSPQPFWLTHLLFENLAVFLAGLVAALIAALLAVRSRHQRSESAVVAAVLGCATLLMYTVWHTAPIEHGRHMITVSVAARIAILLLAVFSVERLVTGRSITSSDQKARIEQVATPQPA